MDKLYLKSLQRHAVAGVLRNSSHFSQATGEIGHMYHHGTSILRCVHLSSHERDRDGKRREINAKRHSCILWTKVPLYGVNRSVHLYGAKLNVPLQYIRKLPSSGSEKISSMDT